MITRALAFGCKLSSLSIETIGELSLSVVEYDAQKSPLHLTHAIKMWMIKKVELDHLVN